MDGDRRESQLEELRREREQTRAAAIAEDEDEAMAQRRQERNVLVQRLLSERGAGAVPPPPRTAWDEHLDRHTSRLQAELGLSAGARPATTTATTASDALAHAAQEQAALEADALQLGAVGVTDLEAMGQQAAVELDRLGAFGASALAASMTASDAPEAELSALGKVPQRAAPPYVSLSPGRERPGGAASGVSKRGGDHGAKGSAHDSVARGGRGGAASSRGRGGKPPAAPASKGAGKGGGTTSSPAISGAPPSSRSSTAGTASAAPAATVATTPPSARGAAEAGVSDGDGYSFQPRINERSAKLASSRDGNCYSRLASQRSEAYAKREIQRMETEKDRLAECTFAPQINIRNAAAKADGAPARADGAPSAGRAATTRRASAGFGGRAGGGEAGGSGGKKLSAGERLHREADKRAEMKERTRVAQEQWELRHLSFAPHINPVSTLIAEEGGHVPLHERVELMQREKEEHLHEIRMKVAEEQDATYAPQINPLSSSLAAAANAVGRSLLPIECGGRLSSGGDAHASTTSLGGAPRVVERLSLEASLALERRAQRELQRRELEASQCTFKPTTNKLSDLIVAEQEAANGDGAGGVFTRLQQAADDLDARRKERVAQAAEEEAKLFQPQVSAASDILLTARAARLNESALERSERLAYVDPKRKEAIIEQLQQQVRTARPTPPPPPAVALWMLR